MLSYVLKQLHGFIPDTELEESKSILKYNPIPSNVPLPAPLPELLRGVLEENHKHSQMQKDKLLQKMQQKLFNVLGPLSKIWQKIEDSTQCKIDRVEINLCEFKELIEQSIMMLGQVFNNIMYNRRLSVLNALMKEHKSEQMLKEKAGIFSESHKELLGQNVRESRNTNQKYEEVLHKETKPTPTTFSWNRPPSRRGPPASSSSSSYERGGGGRAPQAFFIRIMQQTQRQHVKSNKTILPQHSTTSGCRQVKSTSFGQKLFPSQVETGSTGRKTKMLFKKLGKINSKCEYFVHCAWFQNSFLPNPISIWSSLISKGEPRGKVTNKFRNKGNVQERCNSTGEIRTWGTSEQFFLSKQKGWRSSTCNKSHISGQLHTIPTFQNGRDAFNKGSSPRT